MCFNQNPKMPDIPEPIRPAVDNTEANRQADIEAALRRRRAGAAANVLTSPVGLPAGGRAGTSKLGVPAQ